VPASRSSAVRKPSSERPLGAQKPSRRAVKAVRVEVAYPDPVEDAAAGALTAPRPAAPRGRDFSASIYLAARPFCLTRLADTPQNLVPAPGDSLIRGPRDLVVRLGQMPIELAAPMLAADLPALDAQALLALVKTTGEAHHAVIAKRRPLDWRVAKAILRAGHEIAVLALAENPDVAFDDEDRAALTAFADRMIMVRGALLGRKGFVFSTGGAKLNIDDNLGHANLRLVKLARAGRHAVFIRDAARRLDVTANGLAAALSASPDVSLALLICALGMDRAVFGHLLTLWRKRHGLGVRENGPHEGLLFSIFALSPEAARRKLAAGLPRIA